MKYIKVGGVLFTLLAILYATNFWAASGVKVSSDTEFFRFTVEFRDSAFVSEYKDSLDLIKARVEISLLLAYAELMIPSTHREEVDNDGFMPLYSKIRSLERQIETPSVGEIPKNRLIQSRNALAELYGKVYEHRQFDAVAPKYRGD